MKVLKVGKVVESSFSSMLIVSNRMANFRIRKKEVRKAVSLCFDIIRGQEVIPKKI